MDPIEELRIDIISSPDQIRGKAIYYRFPPETPIKEAEDFCQEKALTLAAETVHTLYTTQSRKRSVLKVWPIKRSATAHPTIEVILFRANDSAPLQMIIRRWDI